MKTKLQFIGIFSFVAFWSLVIWFGNDQDPQRKTSSQSSATTAPDQERVVSPPAPSAEQEKWDESKKVGKVIVVPKQKDPPSSPQTSGTSSNSAISQVEKRDGSYSQKEQDAYIKGWRSVPAPKPERAVSPSAPSAKQEKWNEAETVGKAIVIPKQTAPPSDPQTSGTSSNSAISQVVKRDGSYSQKRQDAYIKLDRFEVDNLLEKTKGAFDGVVLHPENTVVMARELPFYNGCRLYFFADRSHMPPAQWFIVMKGDGDKVVVLDFTNKPIYALDSECPIALSRDNVRDYVRFFFTFVRGRHGRFIIVETVDDIAWRDEPPPAARKSIAELIKPISFYSVDKQDGGYFMQAQMMFKDSLFQADIMVKPDGLVQLSNESELVEHMPVLDDTFGQ